MSVPKLLLQAPMRVRDPPLRCSIRQYKSTRWTPVDAVLAVYYVPFLAVGAAAQATA
jgi:hypothetical protein